MALAQALTEKTNCYVYRHIRLDTNVPFYVGIGTQRDTADTDRSVYCRAYESRLRNIFWKRVIARAPYKIQILCDNLTEKDAKEKERDFIKLYGRRNLGLGTLVNLTDGGEGHHNVIYTDEIRRKMSEAQKKYVAIHGSPMKGRKQSAERIEQMRQRMLNDPMRLGGNNANSKKVIDINSKKIYSCIKECALANNISSQILRNRLAGQTFNDTPFRLYNNTEAVHHYGLKSRKKQVINLETNKVYSSAKEVAKLIGMNYWVLKTKLAAKFNNETPYRYYVDGKIQEAVIRKSIYKKVINTETGEVYPSMIHVAKMLNINTQTFNRWMRNQQTNKSPYKLL